jgi:magnesium chelatase accessory protein
MYAKLNWDIDGRDWPHRRNSQFVVANGLRWHTQQFGSSDSPCVLLIHGTGASCHSWRGLAPLLAARARVVVVDLPGHGFTEHPAKPYQYSLPGMSTLLACLVQQLALNVQYAIGHSAGAALLAWMCLERHIAPAKLTGINAALMPLRGIAGQVFSPMAKALWASGAAPHLFAWRASNSKVVTKLLGTTGSTIDAAGQRLYAQLISNSGHVEAALAMMAHWDLPALSKRLAELQTPLELIIGEDDNTVPPEDANRVKQILPGTKIHTLPQLGHLAHEERPDLVDSVLALNGTFTFET